MKAKRIFLSSLLALVSCLSFTACSVKILDRTPAFDTASPSGNYTLRAQAYVQDQSVDLSSLNALVVIDGEQHPMTRDDTQGDAFSFDYQVPLNELRKRFYYVLNYQRHAYEAAPSEEQIISDLYHIEFPNTITLSLQSKRATSGSRVAITGQGFTPEDIVFVDAMAARTECVSATELQFEVPQAAPGHGYSVEVRGTQRAQHAGYLRIDPPSPLRVLPDRLELHAGQRQALVFALNQAAPAGGLQLSFATDIPNCLSLPEVRIPEGAHTLSSHIDGRQSGSGKLLVRADALPEIIIPVTVH